MNDEKCTSSTCTVCIKEFSHRPEPVGKRLYCGRSCYNKTRRRRTKVPRNCLVCKDVYYGCKHKVTKYCSLKCKHFAFRADPSRIVNMRKWLISEGKFNNCENCGYDTCPAILGIHHKNKNHSDNRIENLAVLCANCHSLEHKKHIVHG